MDARLGMRVVVTAGYAADLEIFRGPVISGRSQERRRSRGTLVDLGAGPILIAWVVEWCFRRLAIRNRNKTSVPTVRRREEIDP